MSEDPDNLVLHLLREMRTELKDMRAETATKSDVARLENGAADARSEAHSLRADVATDLISLEKRLSDQIVALRRAVMEYHSSAIGHGVLFSEIEDRVRRLEQHLGLASGETH